MRLYKPGIYRIIGEKFELLANVIGEAPCLRITSALVINDLVQYGVFRIVEEQSLEIQEILTNPDKFIFMEYEYSDICTLPPYRKTIRGTKKPVLTDEQLKDFTRRYKEDMFINKRGINSTKCYIMETTGWSIAQINVLLLSIARKIKNNGSE